MIMLRNGLKILGGMNFDVIEEGEDKFKIFLTTKKNQNKL